MTPTPEQIAAKLTEAQKRALRDPTGCAREDFVSLLSVHFEMQKAGTPLFAKGTAYTPLGRAVLAVLDGGK